METELTNILEELSLEEVDQLLDTNVLFAVNTQTAARIKSSVLHKAGIKKRYFWNVYSKNVMVASVVVCMLLLTGIVKGHSYYKEPVAYLDVDINPSIELGINRWDRIVEAKGYNREGEKILEITSVLNKKVEAGVKEIIEEADKEGFFNKEGGGAVALTSVTDDSEEAQKLTEASKEAAEEYIAVQEIEVEVITENVALERRVEAKEIGITPGKLNLIQKLQALDDKIVVEEYKDTSVKEIMKSIKELKKDMKENSKADKQDNTLPETSDSQDRNETDNETELDQLSKDQSETKKDNKAANQQNNKEQVNGDKKKDSKINQTQDNKTSNKQNKKVHNKQGGKIKKNNSKK
ncbi:MAG: hypothetical protein K0S71_1705 [Clostridia bacterium]|nr:hypothetical protein [Clostridia bacterium]